MCYYTLSIDGGARLERLSADGVARSIADSMQKLCESIEQAGYNEIDWYYTADAHDGHVFEPTQAA